MNSYTNLHTQDRSNRSFLKSAPLGFRIAWIATVAFILAVAVFVIVQMVTMYTSGGGYSYKVEYQYGNSQYTEEYSFNR